MSRIGNKPITIPEGVTLTIDGATVTVKGSKGELKQTVELEYVSLNQEGELLTVARLNDSKASKSRHGLYRSLIQNLIEGVQNGFSKELEVRGVGYRVAQKGTALEFNLGFSHPVLFEIPEGITITFNEKNNNIFVVSGINKQLVGQVASNIRSQKKPEPYKGKGIRYTDEHVIIKAGKSGKA